ncbi:MAG: hypothetical protein L3J05_03570 [Robiginitomaculum sp.]|nr:hypothetical protein [Robiginitomaculum sp.]
MPATESVIAVGAISGGAISEIESVVGITAKGVVIVDWAFVDRNISGAKFTSKCQDGRNGSANNKPAPNRPLSATR